MCFVQRNLDLAKTILVGESQKKTCGKNMTWIATMLDCLGCVSKLLSPHRPPSLFDSTLPFLVQQGAHAPFKNTQTNTHDSQHKHGMANVTTCDIWISIATDSSRLVIKTRHDISKKNIEFYVSPIVSGEGRHTTHLLKCVPLLSIIRQADWSKQNKTKKNKIKTKPNKNKTKTKKQRNKNNHLKKS